MVKVICVDDARELTNAWAQFFNSQPDMRVVASLARADDLAASVVKHKPDVVLMDLDMPGRDPVAATAELSSAYPLARVVFCSGHVGEELVSRAIDAGAWGYLDKLQEPIRIADALRRVACGEVVITVGAFSRQSQEAEATEAVASGRTRAPR